MTTAIPTERPRKRGAAMHQGPGEQTVVTPGDLLVAVQRRFGRITIDLAATAENARAPKCITPEEDSLSESIDWADRIGKKGVAWLNPPFKHMRPWVQKASATRLVGSQRIVVLGLASVASEWFALYVARHALVLPLRPRVTFLGHSDPYPSDLMLMVYGMGAGFEPWRWDAEPSAEVTP